MIWQKGLVIFDMVYGMTRSLPQEEKFGLINQMRRCAVSVSSNIAEGWGREQTKSFINYLRIARSSLFELDTQLVMCLRQKYISQEEYEELANLIDQESRMIKGLISSLNRKSTGRFQELEGEYFTRNSFDQNNSEPIPQNSEHTNKI